MGFWPEQAGAGLGVWGQASEGSRWEVLRELLQVSFADPGGPALPSPGMRTGPSAPLGAQAPLTARS